MPDTIKMQNDPSECNIKVVCRFRPHSSAEVKSGGSLVAKFPSSDTLIHSVSIFS